MSLEEHPAVAKIANGYYRVESPSQPKVAYDVVASMTSGLWETSPSIGHPDRQHLMTRDEAEQWTSESIRVHDSLHAALRYALEMVGEL